MHHASIRDSSQCWMAGCWASQSR